MPGNRHSRILHHNTGNRNATGNDDPHALPLSSRRLQGEGLLMAHCSLLFILNLALPMRTLAQPVWPAPPLLPQATVDVSMPDTSGYTVVQVNAGGDLQAAIDSASCSPTGTVIKLQAGATFAGSFTLPAKACAPGQWIILRSDAPDASLPAPGVRINPSYIPLLPQLLITPETINQPALAVAQSATNYRLMFLEVAVSPAIADTKYAATDGALIDIEPYPTTADQQPHNIIVDRVLVRGSDDPPIHTQRGVELGCAYCAVVNSYIDQIHAVGAEAQAIGGWSSTGPWLIENNYLSAAGENILIGGADVLIPNALPSDIVIKQNYIFKPLSWDQLDPSYAGTPWTNKNFLELKLGVRVLIEGNVFENSLSNALQDYPIVFNTANTANTPWADISDVTLRDNKIIHAVMGGVGVGSNSDSVEGPSLGFQRVAVYDNLFYQQGGKGGFYFQVSSAFPPRFGPLTDVLFDHNTVVQQDPSLPIPSSAVALEAYGSWGPLGFHNNIFLKGIWSGIWDACWTDSSQTTPEDCYTDDSWWDDLAYGVPESYPWCSPVNDGNIWVTHGLGCPIADLTGVGFVDPDNNDYHLSPTSPGYQAATDGKDVGADIDAVNAATAGVAQGNPPPPSPPTNLTAKVH